jgi:uncharacterized pyridoxamine 5'-phosphate oxidase family protein
MQEVIKLLSDNANGFLGTIDNGKPRVRPFQYQFEDHGKLYFCTSNKKDVYAQLRKLPSIEFATTSHDYVTVRINGEVKFSDDLKLKERIISSNEMVRGVYNTADNPNFTLFYLEHGSTTISDFSGRPPRKFQF